MKILTLLLAATLLLTWDGRSNCWRGLTPLHSSCDDVKRILGVDSCSTPLSNYNIPDFQVVIEFVNATCDSKGRRWRVAAGTITAITLTPQKEMLPSEFGLDLSNYEVSKDDEIVGVVHYESRREGVTAILYRGFVQSLYLYPRANDEKLRCKPEHSVTTPHVGELDQKALRFESYPRTVYPHLKRYRLLRESATLADKASPQFSFFP